MLPITRATLQSFCRVCLRELPANAASSNEPNHDINEDQLHKVLLSISGVTMKSSELSLYPQSICHGCYVKTNAFWKFRDKAIVGTGVLKILVSESLQEKSLEELKSYCRVCLRKGNNPSEKLYTTEKNGEVSNLMLECTGLHLAEDNTLADILEDDGRFPSHLCSRCYATLKNFKEFRAVSKQTEEYLQGTLGGVQEDLDQESKSEKEKSHGVKTEEEAASEQEIVVEQLPICPSIKSESCYYEYDDVDYDYEMPIECQYQMNSQKHDGDGVDLDAVEIKKEINAADIDMPFILKAEISETLLDKASTAIAVDRGKRKAKKVSKAKKDDFNDWDSHSSEENIDDSDDSDFEEKKEKEKSRNPLNKARVHKSKNWPKNKKVPQTRSNTRSKKERKASENIGKDETCSSLDNENEEKDASHKNPIEKPKFSRKSRATFSCTECNKNFYKKYLFEAHMKGIHEGIEKPFACQYCDSSFRLVQLLNRHVNAKHASELTSNEDPFTSSSHICVFCQRPFKRKDHLKEHIRTVHQGLKPFECKVCGKTFGSRNTQVRHEKNHSEARPYACEFCGKRYNSETELKVHLQRHTTNPDLLCPICKRGKPNAEELQKHIEMHEASRQHQCPKCGKVFTKLYHLREHDSAVHLKLRPFKCSLCDLTFGIRKTLKTHERRHNPTDRPEPCSMCNLHFKNKRSLLLHVKKTHPTADDNTKDDTVSFDSEAKSEKITIANFTETC